MFPLTTQGYWRPILTRILCAEYGQNWFSASKFLDNDFHYFVNLILWINLSQSCKFALGQVWLKLKFNRVWSCILGNIIIKSSNKRTLLYRFKIPLDTKDTRPMFIFIWFVLVFVVIVVVLYLWVCLCHVVNFEFTGWV